MATVTKQRLMSGVMHGMPFRGHLLHSETGTLDRGNREAGVFVYASANEGGARFCAPSIEATYQCQISLVPTWSCNISIAPGA